MARALLAALVAATLNSCASVPMASASADAIAKQFLVPPNRSRIYLVRPSGVAPAVLFRVTIDERVIGLLPVHAYFVADVQPGEHRFVAAGRENEDAIALRVESGRAYFLRVGPRPGWLFARAAIYEIPDAEGREVVSRASLAKGYD